MARRDAAGIGRFFKEEYRAMLAYVRGRIRDTAARDGEDIVQDVWLTALRGVDRYEGRGRLYTWLCGIALHKVQDHWRRVGRDSSRRYSPPREDETDETLDLIDTEPLPEEVLEREETRELVREAVSLLPEHYRVVLLLKYVEQLSAREIAVMLSKSPKAVESSLCRARLALRDCIQRRMGER